MIPARAVLDAVKAALTAAGVTVLTERTRVTDATLPLPFVVLEGPAVKRRSERVQRHASSGLGTFQTTAMGVDSTQTMWLQSKVEAALLDVVLTVPGYRVDPLVQDAARWLDPFTDLPDRAIHQYATVWRVRTQDA